MNNTQSLAVKYRPTAFEDVVGQTEVRQILENQLATNTIQHAYLFCGGVYIFCGVCYN